MPVFPLEYQGPSSPPTHACFCLARQADAFCLMKAVEANNGATKDVQIARFFRVYIIPTEQYSVESLARAHKSSQCHWPLSPCCQIRAVNSFWQAESNDIKRRARKCVVFQQANWRVARCTECFFSRALLSRHFAFRASNHMQILTAE